MLASKYLRNSLLHKLPLKKEMPFELWRTVKRVLHDFAGGDVVGAEKNIRESLEEKYFQYECGSFHTSENGQEKTVTFARVTSIREVLLKHIRQLEESGEMETYANIPSTPQKTPKKPRLGSGSETQMSVFYGWRNMLRKNKQSRRPGERELNNNTERKWSSSLDCLMYSRTLKNELMHLKNGQVLCRWICDMICTSFNRYICHKMLQMFSSSVFLFPEKLCELFIHLTRNKM